MVRPIPVGARGSFTLIATPAHLANQFKDAALPPVFATPMEGDGDGKCRAQCRARLSGAGRERRRHNWSMCAT